MPTATVARLRPPVGRHLLEGDQAVGYDEGQWQLGRASERSVSRAYPRARQILFDGVRFGNGCYGAAGERIRDVEIAVGALSAQRNEEARGQRCPRS